MPAPTEIQHLVEKFQHDEHRFTASDYNEMQVRREFIDPFFAALGWNVQDSLMVVHEDRVNVKNEDGRNQLKYPDYGFRVGKDTRFYVEAKAPAVRLTSDARPAYQVRRYGWSANLPLSILTDFEEFIIYNCTIKPEKEDAAHIARIGEPIRYTDYVAKWDELYALFSRDAVLAGSLEDYVRGKDLKGTLRVDEAFLRTLETWRELLAKDIALHNPQLSRRDLNIAVQRTIDRIVFLRICEDRSIEPYGRLLGHKQRRDIYEELKLLFRQANDKYNSGLFHFTDDAADDVGDGVSLKIHLDDVPLQTVIGGLYYPDSPYVFAVLPSDILGQVYERFLGKVIELSPGGAVAVTEKPEVRKAGGVYYTPTYIVDYIVRQTIGVLVQNKTPDAVAKLKILDPACGSGSFLIGAYQYLLDWHLDYYVHNRPKTALKDGQLRENGDGSYALTTAEKKRILLNNLYGVDLDQQAVEVTKLSLLLKMLEGETSASAQPKLLSDRILPDLASNIKWGNSLIAPDFYEGKQLALFDDEEFYRVRAFDWRDPLHGFGAIMQSGGFDAVIGNPPYGADLSKDDRTYLGKKFKYGTTDTAALMMIQAKRLLKSSGINGFIVPKPFLYASNWDSVRNDLLAGIQETIDVGKAWKEVKLEQMIYIYHRIEQTNTYRSYVRVNRNFNYFATVSTNDCKLFGFYLNGINDTEILIGKKIAAIETNLNDFVTNTRGGMFQSQIQETTQKKRVLGGKNIARYRLSGEKGFIETIEDNNAVVKPNSILAQNIVAHIMNPTDHIKIIATIPDKETVSDLVILDTVNQLVNISNVSSKFLLGLLSSQLLNWYVYRFIFGKAIRTMHFDSPVTKRIPIPKINFDDPTEKAQHDTLVALVEKMLAHHQELANASGQHKKALEQLIASTDREIDNLVYALYGLTEEEIAIVEGR